MILVATARPSFDEENDVLFDGKIRQLQSRAQESIPVTEKWSAA